MIGLFNFLIDIPDLGVDLTRLVGQHQIKVFFVIGTGFQVEGFDQIIAFDPVTSDKISN
jgi:hypothetical protein